MIDMWSDPKHQAMIEVLRREAQIKVELAEKAREAGAAPWIVKMETDRAVSALDAYGTEIFRGEF